MFQQATWENADIWITSAVLSFASCSAVFVIAPRIVEKLVKPYGGMAFRNNKDKDSSGGRYVTFLHAVIVAAINFYILFTDRIYTDNPKGPMDAIWQPSKIANISLGISLGYFVLDAAVVAWYIPAMGGVEMLTHHVCAFLSVLATTSHQCVQFYTLMLLATEVTTPFINLRWFLEKMRMKGTKWYRLNGVMLVISWFWARIVLFVYLFHHLYTRRDQIPYIPLPVATPLMIVPPTLAVLNAIWFSKILKGAFKVFKRPPVPVSNGISKESEAPKANGKANGKHH